MNRSILLYLDSSHNYKQCITMLSDLCIHSELYIYIYISAHFSIILQQYFRGSSNQNREKEEVVARRCVVVFILNLVEFSMIII